MSVACMCVYAPACISLSLSLSSVTNGCLPLSTHVELTSRTG